MSTPVKKIVANGTVVYFKRARTQTTGGKKKEFQFLGHGFGIFLGHVPPGMPDPPIDIVIAALGGIGYVSFDSIKEFVGKKIMTEIVEKWQAKYTKRLEDIGRKAINAGLVKLVGPDGNPIALPEKPPPLRIASSPDAATCECHGFDALDCPGRQPPQPN